MYLQQRCNQFGEYAVLYQPFLKYVFVKKIVTLLLITGSTSTLLSAQVFVKDQKFRNHLEMDNLKGNVKTVKEYKYELIRQTRDTLPAKNTIDYYFVTHYNNAGNITERTQYRGDNSVANRKTYAYDLQNRITVVTDSTPNTLPGVHAKKMDRYTYNKSGNLIRKTDSLLNNRSVTSTTTYTYNSANQLTSLLIHYLSGNVTDKRTYTYDVAGNVKEMLQENRGSKGKTIFRYRPGSKLPAERVMIYKDSLFSNYQYDPYDNLVSVVTHDGEKKSYYTGETSKYEFDKQHNWIVKYSTLVLTSDENRSTLMMTREIVYY